MQPVSLPVRKVQKISICFEITNISNVLMADARITTYQISLSNKTDYMPGHLFFQVILTTDEKLSMRNLIPGNIMAFVGTVIYFC
jgi:hypothetical protein